MTLRRGWVSQPSGHTSETITDSVGRFAKIDVLASRYESRPTIYNQLNVYRLGVPSRVGQWARKPRPYDYRQFYKCQHALVH